MIDKTNLRAALQSSRPLKYGCWAAGAVVLFAALSFLAAPPIARHVAVKQLSEALHRPVSIRKVSVNPFALTLTVEGLDIKEREGGASFAGFESLFVNLQASSLFRWGPVVDEIRLVDPKFRVARLAENRYSFSDLIDEFAATPAKEEEGGPPAFSLNNIQISGGRVDFDDRVLGEKHVIEEVALTLPFVSSMDYAAEIFVEPHFSAKIDGAPFDVKGKSKPFSTFRESEFELVLHEVRLPEYFDYLPLGLPVKLDSGLLDADLKLSFGQEPGKKPRLVISGTASIDDLRVTGTAGQPLAALKRIEVAVGSADVFGGRLAIDRVALDSPEISARVGREGRIDWLDLLPPADSEKTDDSGASEADGEASPPFEWSLAEATLSGGAVHWNDESHARAFQASITDIGASLKNLDSRDSVADFELACKADGGEALKIDAFAIREGKLDLAQRKVRIGEARLEGAKAAIKRSAEGRIEWIEPPVLRPSEGRPAAPAGPEKADGPGWTVDVEKAAVNGVNLSFEDSAVSPRAVQNIEGLSLDLAGVSSEAGKKAALRAAFRLNRKGAVAVDGKIAPMPLDADLNLDLKTIDLLPLQAYFSEKLNLAVTRGYVTLKGRLGARQGGAGAGEPGALSGGFTGQATVGDFQATDGEKSTDFLRWKSFRFDRIDARFGPGSVSIGDIALSSFFARVIVSPEGKLNLLGIVREDGETGAPETAAPAESPDGRAVAPVATGGQPALPVKIGRITLQGGDVRFTDNFVKPNYSANLSEIGGSVSGLSSAAGTRASLELRGRYDKVAPLDISAQINPLSAKPYLDLTAEVKDIELTSLSTYAEKYAGYAIDKGKLSLSVKYRIEDDRLEAENRVFLDQLTFGGAVESPDATSLPVRLAVSLLKNRKGEIDIDVPVSGSLNDPHFSVGGVIVQVIVNLIGKAVTSPFALIGSMFGGEELASVDFDPGRAALTPDAVKRLENLAVALIDRPEIRFEIEGRANPGEDAEGLKRARLDRKVRALKREDEAEESEEAAAAAVEVTPQEYPELLERVYRAEKFPKPRNVVGLTKSLPVEEMEKLILDHSPVGEEDMKNLADRRAKAVRDWLIAHAVPAERIFLLPDKVGPGDEGRSGRSADFSLK
jgi:uncharacterized protein involved in outer membrane biogenesis